MMVYIRLFNNIHKQYQHVDSAAYNGLSDFLASSGSPKYWLQARYRGVNIIVVDIKAL